MLFTLSHCVCARVEECAHTCVCVVVVVVWQWHTSVNSIPTLMNI